MTTRKRNHGQFVASERLAPRSSGSLRSPSPVHGTLVAPRERRARVGPLLERAERGDSDAAHVLVDVLHEVDTDLAEDLALALAGRAVTPEMNMATREYVLLRGDPIADHNVRIANIARTIRHVRDVVFPKRASPCMPGRTALRNHFADVHGLTTPAEWGEQRHFFVQLWAALRYSCNSRTLQEVECAMRVANDLLRGHGVEALEVETRHDGRKYAFYVNTGETYDRTLVWDRDLARYLLTSWGDVVEGWERRWGRADDE